MLWFLALESLPNLLVKYRIPCYFVSKVFVLKKTNRFLFMGLQAFQCKCYCRLRNSRGRYALRPDQILQGLVHASLQGFLRTYKLFLSGLAEINMTFTFSFTNMTEKLHPGCDKNEGDHLGVQVTFSRSILGRGAGFQDLLGQTGHTAKAADWLSRKYYRNNKREPSCRRFSGSARSRREHSQSHNHRWWSRQEDGNQPARHPSREGLTSHKWTLNMNWWCFLVLE